ncbi:MAG: terminase family protein [Chitinophagaceae bacterium]|nr:terminase family protein [Nitrosomonas sp.]MCW5929885.1 terminase family protein [Chitinophagaceae bacterium]
MPETREIRCKANIPQSMFLSLENKFRAFVSGYGGGKTWVGAMSLCKHFYENPYINAGYFAPTYPMIRDIFYPTIEEVGFNFGFDVKINQANKEVSIYLNGKYEGTILCRSLDNPGSVIGFKIGHALIDEFDTMPTNKAMLAWRKVMARMRYKVEGLKNGIDVTTTPEGFMATHKIFIEDIQNKPDLAKNYGIVQASTYDNEKNLPDDYIPSLVESYPAELIQAYLHGQFVNLKSGTVYRSYNRVSHHSDERIKEGEPLYIGMDFNVQHMAASVFVQRPNGWHAVAELKDVFDTPDMARIIKERWKDKGHRIIIYPDASGGSRKSSDASISDLSILRQSGFEIRVNNTNPAVKDRINSVNKQFELGKLWVNSRECKTIASCLEKQAYDDNGEPDKKSGFDHMNDALGYCISYEFPINKPVLVTGIGSAR